MKHNVKPMTILRAAMLVMALCWTSVLQAADIKVNGTVVDEAGDPLIGVSVVVEGTKIGTATDIDGNFHLIAPTGKKIRFSYVGYTTKTMTVAADMKVVLSESAAALDEVVVVGYGTAKKKDLSGASFNVDAEKIMEKQPVDIMEALQGEIPGVQIMAVSGAPGETSSIRIRGASTFEEGGSAPLYVVDGIIVDNIDNLNPTDIKSLDVLRDAASTSIYGARGANGVIIVTTKAGEAGTPRIDVSYQASFGFLANKLPQLNREQNEVFTNTIQGSATNRFNLFKSATDSVNAQARTSNDYQDLISQTAETHKIDASISGGTDRLKTYTSIGYVDDKGIIKNSYSKRFTARNKTDYKPFSFITFTTNINFTYTDRNAVAEGNIFYNAIRRPTYSLLYYPDGTLVPVYGANPSGKRNPLQEIYERMNKTNTYAATISEQVQVDFRKDLHFRGSATVNLSYSKNKQYTSPYVYKTSRTDAEAGIDGGSDRMTWVHNYMLDGYLNYNPTFNGVHNLNVMLGASVESFDSSNMYMQAETYLNKELLMPQIASLLKSYSMGGSCHSMASLFGRVDYNWKSRYILQASIRRDGSSRFGSKNRWGTFPSASAAWRFSDESFFSWSNEILTDGKLRASWGINGNDRVGDFDSQSKLTVNSNYAYNGVVGVTAASQLGNPELKWEETKQTDIGVDLMFLDGRITLTADYYHKKTDGLFNNENIPGELGYSTRRINLGAVKNEGFEFNISANPVRNRKFSWTTSLNWSRNKNTILEIAGDPYIYNSLWWVEPGQAAGNFFGYHHLGVYEYDASNAYVTTTDANGNTVFGERLLPVFKRDDLGNVIITKDGGPQLDYYTYQNGQPYDGDPSTIGQMKGANVVLKGGDAIWEDLDGNGNIDSGDRKVLGNAQPAWFAGWSNTLRYGDFTLSFSFYYSHGGLIYNKLLRDLTSYGDSSSNCDPRGVTQGWRFEGHKTDWFTPGQKAGNVTSNKVELASNYLENGSFLRLQNVRLTYKLNNKLAKRMFMRSANVYVYGRNLLTWTNYRGYDPEITSGGVLDPGRDNQKYPKKREFGLGLNIGF